MTGRARSSAADALVIFGITGDLARKMTFRSLYRLERRGLLEQPIIGVAIEDWSLERLRKHARQSITAAGEKIDAKVFARLAARLSYVSGDFSDASTFKRVKQQLAAAGAPAFYLEVPPSLFATVIAGLSEAGALPKRGRVVVEKPFGHDLASARALAKDLHRFVDESQLYRIDHFLGKMGVEEILYLRFANAVLESIWDRSHIRCVEITMAERFGVQDRGGFYDPVGALRDVVVNHLMQILAAAAMEAPSSNSADALKDAKHALFRAMPDAKPAAYVRGQYVGYRKIKGVRSGSTTETYAALRLEVDNPALGGSAVLHPDRQAPAGDADRAACRLRGRTAAGLPAARAPGAGTEPAGRQDRSGDRCQIRAGRSPRRLDRSPGNRTGHGVRRRGRGGADALRGSAARGPQGRQHVVHQAGQRRRDLADRRAALGAPARRPALRARLVGAEGRRPSHRPLRRLARAVAPGVPRVRRTRSLRRSGFRG